MEVVILVNMKRDLHAIAARGAIITASVFTAALQLFSPSSLAYRAAGSGIIIDAVNVIVLALASVALADLVWRDILDKGLILPRLPTHWRHQFCVGLYSALAGAFAIRAFLATGGDLSAIVQAGAYYVLLSAWIATEAAAIAHEERKECRTLSKDD